MFQFGIILSFFDTAESICAGYKHIIATFIDTLLVLGTLGIFFKALDKDKKPKLYAVLKSDIHSDIYFGRHCGTVLHIINYDNQAIELLYGIFFNDIVTSHIIEEPWYYNITVNSVNIKENSRKPGDVFLLSYGKKAIVNFKRKKNMSHYDEATKSIELLGIKEEYFDIEHLLDHFKKMPLKRMCIKFGLINFVYKPTITIYSKYSYRVKLDKLFKKEIRRRLKDDNNKNNKTAIEQ